jgi:hypothetical protein
MPYLCAIRDLLADPATAACVETLLLLIIILFEAYAIFLDHLQVREARKQTGLAKQTYELYLNYFEVTEKRKAEAREKAAATRAAKRAAHETHTLAPEPEVSPPSLPAPEPPDGTAPPPMTLPDDEDEPHDGNL